MKTHGDLRWLLGLLAAIALATMLYHPRPMSRTASPSRSPLPSPSRPTAWVSGTVVDYTDSHPIEGVRVQLSHFDEKGTFTTDHVVFTDATGAFTAGAEAQPGPYCVSYSLVGRYDVAEGSRFSLESGQRRDVGTWRLRPVGRFTATIRHSDGRRVRTDTTVELSPANGDGTIHQWNPSPLGIVKFPPVFKGEYVLAAKLDSNVWWYYPGTSERSAAQRFTVSSEKPREVEFVLP